ncbi:hypothetical protein [Kitasatospora herbaricolor]|uniref:hypothetical protein n=1 Tax=Kitasatospora herbaricolor TaxID=68217 RepID=UPI0036DB0574
MNNEDMDIQTRPGVTVTVYTAACHTSGCPAANESKQVIVGDGPAIVNCGDCGEQITDISQEEQ